MKEKSKARQRKILSLRLILRGIIAYQGINSEGKPIFFARPLPIRRTIKRVGRVEGHGNTLGQAVMELDTEERMASFRLRRHF